ncbi:ATP-binding protein [Streptomyces meridianus]|uniref:ATP-binding protein n=1 Tax=Streptomyces meridianus TaxID=2938945 RepID=A0ABT0XBF7_9ACTN|nr:ATP-binding protein [Streptomyces meridianus]MCM2579852.1 ATP-binding protein [Streptomyces meridianus]
MTGSTEGYAPHPHVGGRTAALRALAAWRMEWPGTPRVVVLTGSQGSGRSRLLTGFLMLCDPEFRKRLPLDDLDPSTVPPELPAPAVPSPEGLTAAQTLWALADHFGLSAARTEDVFTELSARDDPLTVVVPDVDRAGPVRAAGEPARLVREMLKPLAATDTVRLLVDVPRELAAEVLAGLPDGTGRIVDLDDAQWADREGLVRQAEALLDPRSGAPDLPFTTDPQARRALAESVATQAGGSCLTVQLAARCMLMQPEGFDPSDPSLLPGDVAEALDLHARRLGSDPRTLRLMLAPLALAEGDGLPLSLWGPLARAVAERDMDRAITDGMLLAGPFVQPVEAGPAENGGADRTLLRLLHPGVAEEIRSGLPDLRAAQTRVAMAMLESVPGQDWSKADPYVRDHIAGHTLEAGLLPQLLTDPGLFAHADPVALRAAVEAVPLDLLDAPARTYLRTAPLLTRTQAPAAMRAALLETAFVEDGLPEYAAAVHGLGLDLPWRTLWSVPASGIGAVTVGRVPQPPGTDGATVPALPVAVLVVPPGTPGARQVDASSAVLVHHLMQPGHVDTDPQHVLRPTDEERAAAPLGLSRGSDYLRVWDRTAERIVTALVSDTPVTAADISPDGVLVIATERGARALWIRPPFDPR